jgi:hypothetical protein
MEKKLGRSLAVGEGGNDRVAIIKHARKRSGQDQNACEIRESKILTCHMRKPNQHSRSLVHQAKLEAQGNQDRQRALSPNARRKTTKAKHGLPPRRTL